MSGKQIVDFFKLKRLFHLLPLPNPPPANNSSDFHFDRLFHPHFAAHMKPSWSLAASDILLGSQGGSKTTSTPTSLTPERLRILLSMSPLSTWHMPQPL